MKTTLKIGFMSLISILMTSCGTTKTVLAPAVESSRTTTTSLEGDKVILENLGDTGYEKALAFNDDGTDLIEVPYKWFAGHATIDNKQMAIDFARENAYATISGVINKAVQDHAKRSAVANNGHSLEALTAHWEQFSQSLLTGCEPFGNVTIEYNPSTRMYTATAKVAIRGDRFNQLLKTAGDFKPSNLTGDDLEQFIQANKAIMEAARGN